MDYNNVPNLNRLGIDDVELQFLYGLLQDFKPQKIVSVLGE